MMVYGLKSLVSACLIKSIVSSATLNQYLIPAGKKIRNSSRLQSRHHNRIFKHETNTKNNNNTPKITAIKIIKKLKISFHILEFVFLYFAINDLTKKKLMHYYNIRPLSFHGIF